MYLCVCHPAARFYLIGIKTPKFEFFFEQRTTHIRWIMQFSRSENILSIFYTIFFFDICHEPIIVQYLGKYARMTIEEVLVQYGIIIGQRFGQPRQPGGRNLFQRCFVCLVTDSAYIQHHPILRVHIQQIVHFATKIYLFNFLFIAVWKFALPLIVLFSYFADMNISNNLLNVGRFIFEVARDDAVVDRLISINFSISPIFYWSSL